MNTLFLTGHIMQAPRRASMLFLAEAMANRGDSVLVFSTGYSWISYFKAERPWKSYALNRLAQLTPTLAGYIWFPWFHPFNLKNTFLNKLATPLFRLYSLLFPISKIPFVPGSIVVESGPSLFFVPRLRKAFPKATFLYNVTDRLETLNTHPLLHEAERKALPHFQVIRVPAKAMLKDYPGLPAYWIPHGIDKTLFDKKHPTPYPKGSHNVVSVGDMLFDAEAVSTLAKQYPAYTFHLFGAKAKLLQTYSNVIEHGETPFATIVPYIQHANLGLAPYRPAPHAEYLAQSSLKLIQYTYSKLPILAPGFATAGQQHMFGYTPGNPSSLKKAFEKATQYPRENIPTTQVQTWPEVLNTIESHLA